ncbi:MAG: D-ribose pyranase [Candidatus Limnocylindrales bacterium]|jgi:D-ribose pyranase
MRKTGILNQEILKATGSLGHTDQIVVCDAGLPIPLGVERIDLTVLRGMPRFLDVLKPLLAEVIVEKIILATEIEKASPEMLARIRELAGAIPIEFVSHDQFKRLTRDAKAIIRTGEFTPYTNIILQSGVDFS